MPPPPPPSKSYNLVLDSDSEDDDSDEEYHLREEYYRSYINANSVGALQDETPAKDSSRTIKGASSTAHVIPPDTELCLPPRPENDESSNQNSNSGSKKLTKSQKRRKQKRKKKKTTQQDQGNTKTTENSKGISFSSVSIRTFPRAFSGDTVPGHGGWPLGMKLDGHEDLDEISLDEYETNKQKELHERWMAILSSREKKAPGSPKCSSPSKRKKEQHETVTIDDEILRLVDGSYAIRDGNTNENTQSQQSETIVYESRQWDYRSKLKNPLFRSVSEDERHAIFLEASGTDPTKDAECHNHSSSNCSTSQNHRRSRSNSVGNHSHNNGDSRRSRSNSVGNHDIGNSIKGVFNKEYSQAMVHHVRNELEQIRIERNKSGATGCNCRKLVVYLPPKDGSGGKKAQHRRLKPSKVVSELKKRHLYDSTVAASSRDEMEKLLHKVVESEPCCKDEDCFCVRNGIVCQADACSCWHNSHVHAKHTSDIDGHPLTNDDIRKRCGNPLGTYLVDVDTIDGYRKKVITQIKQNGDYKFVCQPTQDS